MSHHANIEVHEDHLVVVQEGALESVPQAEALQQRVESRCQQVGCRRVVFDNRKTTAHTDDVRAAMFDWASTHFDRVALLLESEMIGVRANMEALSRGAKLRAFHDLGEAVAWLRR